MRLSESQYKKLVEQMGEGRAPDSNARAVAQLALDDSGDFDSKTEERAWREWIPTTPAIDWMLHPLILHLASGNYEPDFLLIMPDGELWFIEVKGNWKAYQSGRSSKKSVKEAAHMFRRLGRFFVLMPDRKDWMLEEVKP